ncbi:hypothetical protein PAXRUDRAFT_604421 [Paxillus rubicundulus Ve08.2h10]|uniref:Uncharacterized protein n=1 Tax=Paxillus rubicundulus Ve08.2h10 TaxID=930991 RepID=A0A0D0E470_9AGAM|nr:hypothetical protein PAXRUDRAFT_604421 [Paxillus rubicundulus Ve08.2h10]
MLAFAVIFSIMFIVQQFTHTVVHRRLTRRLGIGEGPQSPKDSIVCGLFVASVMELLAGVDAPNLEPVEATAAASDISVGTSLVPYALIDGVEPQWASSPEPLQVADRASDWQEELRQKPERYLNDIVPWPRYTQGDFICRRWQMGPYGILNTFGPQTPSWFEVKTATQGQRAQSKPVRPTPKPVRPASKPTSSTKSKTASKTTLVDIRRRWAHPRFESLAHSSYADIVTFLQCLAFQYLPQWLSDDSTDDVERQGLIPSLILALYSAVVSFGVVSLVPPLVFFAIVGISIVTFVLQRLASQYLPGWFLGNSADEVERQTGIPNWVCILFCATITVCFFLILPPSVPSAITLTITVCAAVYCCALVYERHK